MHSIRKPRAMFQTADGLIHHVADMPMGSRGLYTLCGFGDRSYSVADALLRRLAVVPATCLPCLAQGG